MVFVDVYKVTPIAIQHALRNGLRADHSVVFNHTNVSPCNIIVSDGRIAGLLDWQVAGWYPEYWRCVKSFECVTVIFEMEYFPELVACQALARWQKP